MHVLSVCTRYVSQLSERQESDRLEMRGAVPHSGNTTPS